MDRDSTSRTWRIGFALFFGMAIMFAFLNSRIEYVLDATGMSGRDLVEEHAAEVKDATQGGEVKLEMPTRPYLWNGGMVSLRNSGQVKVDGKVRDWKLQAGALYTPDARNSSAFASVWFHTMFDDDNFYIFARVRDTRPKNATVVLKDPAHFPYLEVNLKTDQPVAIRCWNNGHVDGVMQLYYYSPARFPRPDQEGPGKDELFEEDELRYRVDGRDLGGQMKIADHDDNAGYDVECAIPWKALCIDVAKAPKAGDVANVLFGARLSQVKRLGYLVKTLNDKEPLTPLHFLDYTPPASFPVLFNTDGKTVKAFRTYIDAKQHRLMVDVDKTTSVFKVHNTRLFIPPPTRKMAIDGGRGDWNPNASLFLAERANELGRAHLRLLTCADDEKIYFWARVFDPAPGMPEDRVSIYLKTDKAHEIRSTAKELTLDGKPIADEGAQLKANIWPLGYGYQMEFSVPWSVLTVDGKKPTASIPCMVECQFNPQWVLRGVFPYELAEPDPKDPSTWGEAVFTDVSPTTPLPIPTMTGDVVCYDVDPANPMKISFPRGKGVARSPRATENTMLDILPGKSWINGEPDGWELKTGQFICSDVGILRNSSSAWVHGMYDQENLYFLFEIKDSSPLEYETGKMTGNDFVRISLRTDQFAYITQCIHRETGKIKTNVKVRPFVKGKRNAGKLRTVIPEGIYGVAKRFADGTG
ncbi:hypothetical protein BVY04_05285, partial [bacterium M21]